MSTASREHIDHAIAEALEAFRPGASNAAPDAELVSDLGLDSAEIMNLMMEIEDRLDVSIPVELLAEVRTLGELSARLERLVASSSGTPA